MGEGPASGDRHASSSCPVGREQRQQEHAVRDDELMARAVAAGERGRRSAPPNPWVGCVLARDGAVVGEGFHLRPGEPHAEIIALRAAGDRARGATAYTTLEPCAHHGRTGPCADALVDAGVARVVTALEDPDVDVRGRGIERLRAARVTVDVGCGAAAATRSLAPYLHHRRTGRALCLAKVATSLDGRLAAADGTSRWITGAAARADAHELRADSQAVVVGSGTALADRPALSVRGASPPPDHPPLRVVLDARGRVPVEGPLFDASLGSTLVLTTDVASQPVVDAWGAAGAKVETVPAASSGGVSLPDVLRVLGASGVLQAMVEGGATLLGSLVREDLVDRLVVYVAPTLLGTGGRPAIDWPGPASLPLAPRLELDASRVLGDDVRIDLVRPGAGAVEVP